ncbi:MAG: hypothetical protein L3J96_02405, partial [Thermoplasmata archaeon]|nr:hypothetical protein [Thermoplasmata archaeon]
LTELDARLTTLSDQVKADGKELTRLTGEEKRLAGQLDAVEKTAESHTADLHAATGEAEQSQGKLAGTRKQILVLQQQQEDRDKRWQQVVHDRESAKASLDASELAKAQAEDDQRTRELELKDTARATRSPGRAPPPSSRSSSSSSRPRRSRSRPRPRGSPPR